MVAGCSSFLSPCLFLVIVLASSTVGEDAGELQHHHHPMPATTQILATKVHSLVVEWQSSEETRVAFHQFCPNDRYQINMALGLEEVIGKIGVNGILDCLSKKHNGMFHHVAHATGSLAASITNDLDLLGQSGWSVGLYGYFHGVIEKLVLVFYIVLSFLSNK